VLCAKSRVGSWRGRSSVVVQSLLRISLPTDAAPGPATRAAGFRLAGTLGGWNAPGQPVHETQQCAVLRSPPWAGLGPDDFWPELTMAWFYRIGRRQALCNRPSCRCVKSWRRTDSVRARHLGHPEKTEKGIRIWSSRPPTAMFVKKEGMRSPQVMDQRTRWDGSLTERDKGDATRSAAGGSPPQGRWFCWSSDGGMHRDSTTRSKKASWLVPPYGVAGAASAVAVQGLGGRKGNAPIRLRLPYLLQSHVCSAISCPRHVCQCHVCHLLAHWEPSPHVRRPCRNPRVLLQRPHSIPGHF